VVHNTTQNSSDNLPSYPQDNYHSSDNRVLEGMGLEMAGADPSKFLSSSAQKHELSASS